MDTLSSTLEAEKGELGVRGARAAGGRPGCAQAATTPVTTHHHPHQPPEDGGGPLGLPPGAMPARSREVPKGHESAVVTERWPSPPTAPAALQLGEQILRIPSGSLLSADPARTMNLGFRDAMTPPSPPREKASCAQRAVCPTARSWIRGQEALGAGQPGPWPAGVWHTLRCGSTCLLPRLARVSNSVSCSVVSDSLQPRRLYPPDSSVHGILQARILEWAAMPSSRGSSRRRDQTASLALKADSLLSELQGRSAKISKA